MKATIKTKHGIIEVEGETTKELFKEMAGAYEIFDEEKCGLCGCTKIRMIARKNKDDEDFFEFVCQGFLETGDKSRCRGYLALGQNKKGGGLFPIRALTESGKPDRVEGKLGRHNGWSRYRGEPKPEGATPAKTGKK